jgi:hypothetical protein
MADSLNMNGLSLNDSKHGPPANMPGGRAYIPPHLRGQITRGPPMNNFDGAGAGAGPTPAGAAAASAQGLNGSAWATNT